tara:strand:- start:65 stop:451 length:387 start_codon:yes stop_codon:yes gene_type:complete
MIGKKRGTIITILVTLSIIFSNTGLNNSNPSGLQILENKCPGPTGFLVEEIACEKTELEAKQTCDLLLTLSALTHCSNYCNPGYERHCRHRIYECRTSYTFPELQECGYAVLCEEIVKCICFPEVQDI